MAKKQNEAAKKASKTRAENYAKASAEEKRQIDELRHQAALKAAQTRKTRKKSPEEKQIDWRAASEKAENSWKSAIEVTKWRINQLDRRWQIVEFVGKKGKESAGIIDMVAIRKDHAMMPKKTGLKPGDLFEIILIQVKAGKAKNPSVQDIKRLSTLKQYYTARDVVLSEVRDNKITFYEMLNLDLDFGSRKAWVKKSLSDLFY